MVCICRSMAASGASVRCLVSAANIASFQRMPDFLCYCVLAPAALAFCIDVVWERHFAPFPHHINTGIAWLRLAAARECLRALATIQVLRGCALWRPASACERWQQYRYCVAAPCGGPQVPASVGNNTGIARRSRTIARKRLMVPLLATRYCAAEPHDCPRALDGAALGDKVLRGGAARLPTSACEHAMVAFFKAVL